MSPYRHRKVSPWSAQIILDCHGKNQPIIWAKPFGFIPANKIDILIALMRLPENSLIDLWGTEDNVIYLQEV